MSGDTRISEIRARLEKATLPWTMEWDGQTLYVNDADGDEIVAQTFAIATWEPEYSQQKAECDTASADLIANAPADIAHLLAVHEQQAARIASLEQERDHARLELLNQEEAARVRTNLQIATFKRLVEQGMQAFRRIVDARTARQEGGDE